MAIAVLGLDVTHIDVTLENSTLEPMEGHRNKHVVNVAEAAYQADQFHHQTTQLVVLLLGTIGIVMATAVHGLDVTHIDVSLEN